MGEHAPALTVSDQALRTAQEYFSEMLRSASPLAYTQHPLQAYKKTIRAETCYQQLMQHPQVALAESEHGI